MLPYQQTESYQKKKELRFLFSFFSGEILFEILEDELVYVRNSFHYITRNTEMTLTCMGKIILGLHRDVLVLSIRLILRNISTLRDK